MLNIRIGNGVYRRTKERKCLWTVDKIVDTNAPQVANNITAQINRIVLTRRSLHELVEIAGIEEFFFGEKGIFHLKELEHGHAYVITVEDVQYMEVKLDLYKQQCPKDVVAGPIDVDKDENQDPALGLLTWLVWWMRYAMQNTKFPIILFR